MTPLSPSDPRCSTAPPLTAREFISTCEAWLDAERRRFSPIGIMEFDTPVRISPALAWVDLYPGNVVMHGWVTVHLGGLA